MLFICTMTVAANDLVYLSDEFDDADSTANWLRIYETEGWNNNVLEVFDANTTRPGQLVMTPYSSSWYEEWRGELTYKVVTGNFVITTFVEPRNRAGTGRPEQDYSLAGIMVRVPRSMTNPAEWTAGGQNYVFLSIGSANRATSGFEYEVKTTSNSTSVLFIEGTDATRAAIQVARIGPHLIMLRQNENENWVIHRRYFRPDFPFTLQAGLTVYTDWNTCAAVGVENNNLLVLTNGATLLDNSTLNGAQPDLVATFDYVRYARPEVPPALDGANFSNPGEVSDSELLSFLGEHANIPGGAASEPEWFAADLADEDALSLSIGVVSQRHYRVQTAESIDGEWTDIGVFISTGLVHSIQESTALSSNMLFMRVATP